MKKQFNKMKKSAVRTLRDNRGLSLTELIVAVAILAIIVVPLLSPFVLSANMESKSRKISEATNAANNIVEVIDANASSALLSGDITNTATQDALKQLGITSADNYSISEDDNGFNVVTLKGITSGKKTYDAKLTYGDGSDWDTNGNGELDEGEYNGFHEINSTEIVDFCQPDAVYCQSYEQGPENPDYKADQIFSREIGVAYNPKKYYKNRTITVDISPEYDDSGIETQEHITKVNIIVYYTYIYRNNTDVSKENGGFDPDKDVDLSDRVTLPIEGKNQCDGYIIKYKICYGASGTGIRPHTDGSKMTFYLMYYPNYYGEGDKNGFTIRAPYYDSSIESDNYTDHLKGLGGAHSFDDLIYISNPKNVEIRTIIAKQWPLELKTDDSGDYQRVDSSTLSVNETKSKPTIVSHHKDNSSTDKYDIYQVNSELYTNAGYDLTNTNTPILGFNYGVYKGYIINYENYLDGSLINRNSATRIYNLTIEIYEDGELEKAESDDSYTAKPVVTVDGSKLNQ